MTDIDDGESLPITGALFSELERMLDEALWALAGFPSAAAYTTKQLDAITPLMAAIGEETHRIKVGLQYRRQVLKRQRGVRRTESSHRGREAQEAKELAAHLAEVHGLADVPVAGLMAAHMHSFGAHPEQARDSCAAFVRPSVAYHVQVLIARNAAATSGEQC